MTGCIAPHCGSLDTLTLVGDEWYCREHLKDSPFAKGADAVLCPSCGKRSAAALWTRDDGSAHHECGICSYTWDTPAPAEDEELRNTLPRLPHHETP